MAVPGSWQFQPWLRPLYRYYRYYYRYCRYYRYYYRYYRYYRYLAVGSSSHG